MTEFPREVVFVLCALTSIACAILLFRGYRESRTRLLFWSSLCFIGLAANNVLLLVDALVVPSVDLSLARGLTALAALMLLLFGLIWEAR
jgi:hypothetical protein